LTPCGGLENSHLTTSKEILGHTKKKNQDWFNENDKKIQDLLAKKRAAQQAHLAQPTCAVKKAILIKLLNRI